MGNEDYYINRQIRLQGVCKHCEAKSGYMFDDEEDIIHWLKEHKDSGFCKKYKEFMRKLKEGEMK